MSGVRSSGGLQQLQHGLHTHEHRDRRTTMALKNTVAAERRLDLASLFCMIGRHGPAVALVVIAMVSMLAAFIIYRTVRGKRRQAAAGDGERSSGGEERDAAVIHPSTEEHHRFRESTGKMTCYQDVYKWSHSRMNFANFEIEI